MASIDKLYFYFFAKISIRQRFTHPVCFHDFLVSFCVRMFCVVTSFSYVHLCCVFIFHCPGKNSEGLKETILVLLRIIWIIFWTFFLIFYIFFFILVFIDLSYLLNIILGSYNVRVPMVPLYHVSVLTVLSHYLIILLLIGTLTFSTGCSARCAYAY